MKLFRLLLLAALAASSAQAPDFQPRPIPRRRSLHSRGMGLAHPLRDRLPVARPTPKLHEVVHPLSARGIASAARGGRARSKSATSKSSRCRAASRSSATCARKNSPRRACSICPILTSFPAGASTKCTAGTVFSFSLDWKSDHQRGAWPKASSITSSSKSSITALC